MNSYLKDREERLKSAGAKIEDSEDLVEDEQRVLDGIGREELVEELRGGRFSLFRVLHRRFIRLKSQTHTDCESLDESQEIVPERAMK